MLWAAGWPGTVSSPDGLLLFLWIRGHVGLHLFSRPLHLHLNDLWVTDMQRSSLLLLWVFVKGQFTFKTLRVILHKFLFCIVCLEKKKTVSNTPKTYLWHWVEIVVSIFLLWNLFSQFSHLLWMKNEDMNILHDWKRHRKVKQERTG